MLIKFYRATCTTALTIRLADNLQILTDAELRHIIAAMRGFCSMILFGLFSSVGTRLARGCKQLR